MQTFTKQTYINTSLEELFKFHLDSNNLIKITPKNIKAELLTKDVSPKEGAILKIKTIKNFIPFTWVVKIEKMDYPNMFMDVAIKSPFKFWEHSHIFEQEDDKVLLKDVVRYELPFGFLGSLLDGFIKKDLEQMFEFRHEVTKKILEGKI
ncbi:SRPBCC family protein [Malaciobacter marinus]|jgi:ligand-binding SRPBCC domain-containing protein|uniref:Ligand-binding SRPBCC domain-containing protein n=1 Tax=Malaciobacter marinus TaxID=505249 RepID=A0AB37A0I2_9BACT|nr:SRPBCC family protein [Malaciobacter marinus]PPK63012.1 ligand-binding SRPBCC domain-containing protein [Malaciobacter marinus]